MRRKTRPSSTSASGAYCTRVAAASTASKATSQTVRGLFVAGWTQSASNTISRPVATNSVIGLWAKQTNSYQNAPARSAARAAISLKCRRAKTYIPAGTASDSAQKNSLTPPTYQNGSPSPTTWNSFSTPATAPGTSHERAP